MLTGTVAAEENVPTVRRDILGEIEQADVVLDQHQLRLEALLKELESKDEKVAIEAGIRLREEAFRSDVPFLSAVVKKGNPPTKQHFLVETLGLLGDSRAAEALRFEFEFGTEATRQAAAIAFGQLRFDWPIPLLAAQVLPARGGDMELAKVAAGALGAIGSVRAIDALRTSYPEMSKSVKIAAAYALDVAEKKVDLNAVDSNFARGQRQTLYYKGLRYLFYQPAIRLDEQKPWLLLCVHDSNLEYEVLFQQCVQIAKKEGLAVLVPFFDSMHYSDYGAFNIRGQRADKQVVELVDHIAKYANIETRELYLFGTGTGGDFVHRFVMAYPKRIARALAEVRNFTYLNADELFPAGVKSNPLAPDIEIDVATFIKSDLKFVFTDKSPVVIRQSQFFKFVDAYAREAGIRRRLSRTTEIGWREVAPDFISAYLFEKD